MPVDDRTPLSASDTGSARIKVLRSYATAQGFQVLT